MIVSECDSWGEFWIMTEVDPHITLVHSDLQPPIPNLPLLTKHTHVHTQHTYTPFTPEIYYVNMYEIIAVYWESSNYIIQGNCHLNVFRIAITSLPRNEQQCST